MDRIGQPGGAQEGGDELAGAVGLVAAGEAAGQDHHLAAADGLFKGLSGLGQQVGGQVADHHDLGLDARPQACLGGVIFAVGAGEDRDDRPGPGRPALADDGGSLPAGDGLHFFRLSRPGGIHLLQHPFVPLQQLGNGGGVLPDGNDWLLGGGADAPGHAGEELLPFQLKHDGAGAGAVPGSGGIHIGLEADGVAEGHLHHRLGHAAGLHRPGGLHLALAAQLVEGVPGSLQLPIGGEAGQQIHRVPRPLEFGRKHFPGLGGGDGEGDQRGGHVQIQEGARHGILAADGSHIQPQLGVHGPQQGREGLAPAQGLVPKLLKILLESEVGLAAVTAGGHQLGHRVHH